MTAFKSEDNFNRAESKTPVDVRNHQHEFETARAEAEKAAMRYCRKCTTSIRPSRKNSSAYIKKLMSGI